MGRPGKTREVKYAFLGLLFLGACGYSVKPAEFHLGGSSPQNTSARPQKIFIPVVDNRTTRTGFEALLTNALRETLDGVRGAQVVGREQDADYILLGALKEYSRSNASSPLLTGDGGSQAVGGLADSTGTARDIRVRWVLDVQLLERVSSESRRRIWQRTFAQEGTYNTIAQRFRKSDGSSSLPQLHASREVVRLKGFSEALARQVLDQVVQDF